MRDGGTAPALPRPSPVNSSLPPYSSEVRPVRWQAVNGPARLDPSAMVEITRAAPKIANSLAAILTAQGYRTDLVEKPSGNASCVVFTEGLADGLIKDRHWSALAAVRRARRKRVHLVFLQWFSGDTGIEGLARTLRLEWSDASAVCLTIAPEVPLERVTDWLGAQQEDLWILNDGSAQRAVLGDKVQPQSLSSSSPGVWLVTGGARGVTASCAIELARQATGTFVLAGRSAEAIWPRDIPETRDLKTLRGLLASAAVRRGEKPSPAAIDKAARSAIAGLEIEDTLNAIRGAGSQAHYVAMDASDVASVRRAISTIQQQFGQITGLIHGAGIIADRLVEEKTETELARVFGPKADGLFHILGCLDNSCLRHVGMFSSASAFFGNRGQSDYAMANAILANTGRALAAQLPSARIKVFDWGPWEGGMVDATLASHFKKQGVPLISISDGARIFAHELLAGDPSDVELVVGNVWSEA